MEVLFIVFFLPHNIVTVLESEENVMSDLTRTSRYLSLLLRHHPEKAGLTLDAHGWAEVDRLIAGVRRTKQPDFDRETLEEIVRTDGKQRYSFNEDHTKIRANQGHSIPVDVELERLDPPEFLWHGTAEKYLSAITREGLRHGSRLYVHLSGDPETAVHVGQRHGRPVVFQVRAGEMAAHGFPFYRSVNGVWLTERVPANYLTLYKDTAEELYQNKKTKK